MLDLDELMRLREAATPGPWAVFGDDGFDEFRGIESPTHCETICPTVQDYAENSDGYVDYAVATDGVSEPNAAYIVAACNAVPELVQRIRELEAQCDWLAETAANAGWHGVRVGKEYMIDQARMAVSHAQAERHECPTPEVSCHAREGKLCMSDNHLACAQADNLQR